MEDLAKTASPLEIAWTLVMLIGVLTAGLNWWDAQGDLDALLASGRDGAILITARGERSDQQALFLALFCNLTLGFLALFGLPSQDPDGGPSAAAQWSAVLLIVAGLSMIYLSISHRRRRKSILEALRVLAP